MEYGAFGGVVQIDLNCRDPTKMSGAMRLLLIALFAPFFTATSHAACVCRCVDGQVQPLCESSIDLPPICPATVCALPLPLAKPIEPPALPPLGTTKCSPRQVLDPDTGQYEWQSVCK
jgi:hypothetical protein